MRLIKRKKLTKRQVKRIVEVILKAAMLIGTLLSFGMFIARLFDIWGGTVSADSQRLCEDITAILITGITTLLCILCGVLYGDRAE